MTGLLPSFGNDLRVAVVGASGGVGAAMALALASDPSVHLVHALSRSGDVPEHAKIRPAPLDILQEDSIADAASVIGGEALHLVFVATGMLHDEERGIQPEKTWRSIDPAAMNAVFAVNATGPALVAKHFLPLLDRKRKSAFAAISARVGSIADNGLGGWYSYRASKAALNQLLKTYAIELARRNPTALCVGLHPGTVDTALSHPFQRGVPDGKLFTPGNSARSMLAVLDRLGADDSGGFFAWDGEAIPF
ncbi:SDR family NAD(P)-dependent oxidoreductase [Hwanghaeella sp.]|uniref:SDR family NAD(P)-dependent oxidoreductase n=1 Tax=Hwanghaeella sp. TaxID=2605943 RepID=UPI003CCBE5BE